MLLKKVEINNFRTLIGFKIEKINSLHVITGINNSGKTNFLRALDLFFNENIEGERFSRQKDMPHHIVYESRSGGARTTIEVTIEFDQLEISNIFRTGHDNFKTKYLQKDGEKNYLTIKKIFLEHQIMDTELILTKNDGSIISVNDVSEEARALRIIFDRIKYFYLPSGFDPSNLIKEFLIEEILSLSFDRFGKTIDYKSKVEQNRNKFNDFLSSVNDLLTTNSQQMTALLRDMLKDTPKLTGNIPVERWKANIYLPTQRSIIDAIKSQVKFSLEDGIRNIPIESKGSGLQRACSIILMEYVLTQIKGLGRATRPLFIWGFDEPEMNLQPGLQKTIFKRLKNIAKDQQIIIATHSPHFVDLYEESKNVTLFDISADLKEIRGKNCYVKTTYLINEEMQKSEFFRKVREHLGISVFDTWHIMKSNFLFEGKSDEQYILSMYNYLIGKSLKGSILVSNGVNNFVSLARFVDNISKEINDNVTLNIVSDFDEQGKAVNSTINRKDYQNIEIKIKFIPTSYLSESDSSYEFEIEDFVIPELYWKSVVAFLMEEKSIPKEKIPPFDNFFQDRLKFQKQKMSNFLDFWLVTKLEGLLEQGIMKREHVKFFIALKYSENLKQLNSEKKEEYLKKYPPILKFLNEL